MDERISLRSIFDQAAQDYDAVRPGYPEALIEDVIAISQLPAGGRILEVGCGTGQATLPFAQRGYAMLCLDIGQDLTAIARRKCLPYTNVRFLVTSFEDWQGEDISFDLVMSATAFHWIAPDVGCPKAARFLKDSGSLAVFTNMHPTPYTGFFAEVQEVYQRIVPEMAAGTQSPADDRIRATAHSIDATGLFEKVTVKQYAWQREYTAERYITLLNTYSDHRRLKEGRRNMLYDGIKQLIVSRFGGKVRRPYLSVLYIARKRRREPRSEFRSLQRDRNSDRATTSR